ncbi:hypothetical protein EVAR_71116_1 [Eumeta japonica]|uniref:Uncharacterized protein n=1 Tax=Eumeta variegata TaxID=151549 RepID=A0A4C2ACY9_EUMVA|nr:hypothetical protein EVAR_71116_1 [Eumeta japonica]
MNLFPGRVLGRCRVQPQPVARSEGCVFKSRRGHQCEFGWRRGAAREELCTRLDSIDRLKPRPAARNSKHIFVYADLKTCNKLFVRNDTVRKTLQPPYDGPFNIIKRLNFGLSFRLSLVAPSHVKHENTKRSS